MQPTLPIQISQAKLAEFCQRHHICRLSLFGSVLRDDFSPNSDVDVLVEFAPGKTPGFAIVTMQQELSTLTSDLIAPSIYERRKNSAAIAAISMDAAFFCRSDIFAVSSA